MTRQGMNILYESRKKNSQILFLDKVLSQQSKMTLHYQMTVERYPNPNEGVGDSIPGCEIFSLLDRKTKHPPIARQGIARRLLLLGGFIAYGLKFTLHCLTFIIIIITNLTNQHELKLPLNHPWYICLGFKVCGFFKVTFLFIGQPYLCGVWLGVDVITPYRHDVFKRVHIIWGIQMTI